jgi:hypothetical protein
MKKSVVISPRANYTDRLTAAIGEVSADLFGYGVLHGQSNRSLRPLISVFYTGAATDSFM